MTSLYHGVPDDMTGTTLYPLNQLKNIYPEIYTQKFAKYIGREYVAAQKIPILDCAWNDVLFFMAVNPRDIKTALLEAGRQKSFSKRYYKVNAYTLSPDQTIIYLYSERAKGEPIPDSDFIKYDPNNLETFSTISQATKDYFKETITRGERPLLYHRIPHILYKGTLNIENLPIVSANER